MDPDDGHDGGALVPYLPRDVDVYVPPKRRREVDYDEPAKRRRDEFRHPLAPAPPDGPVGPHRPPYAQRHNLSTHMVTRASRAMITRQQARRAAQERERANARRFYAQYKK